MADRRPGKSWHGHHYVPEPWKGKTFDKIESADLVFKWQWCKVCKLSCCAPADTAEGQQRLPCQSSEAVLDSGWSLHVAEWSSRKTDNEHEYDFCIDRYQNSVVRLQREDRFATRAEAQLTAERAFKQLGFDITEMAKEVKSA